MLNEMRWYSGKYDSTKQRSVTNYFEDNPKKDSLYNPRHDMYKRYTASLRLEMLLCGTVVVTDAQWYDGMYFSYLVNEAKKGEFESFKKMISDLYSKMPLLEVKRRKNHIRGIFSKPFLFSSLPGETLNKNSPIEIVRQFAMEHSEQIKKNPDLKNYFKLLKNFIPAENSIKEQIGKFENQIRSLDEVTNVFSQWSDVPGIPLAFSQRIKSGKETITRKEKLVKKFICKWAEDAPDYDTEKELSGLAREIERQITIESGFPDRGSIKILVDKSKEIYPIKTLFFDDFFNHFNTTYNRGLTLQHGCKFYDVVEMESNSKKMIRKASTEIEHLPEKAITCLANMSWSDFHEIMKEEDIFRNRSSWLENCTSLSLKPNDDTRRMAEETIIKYNNAIAERIVRPNFNCFNADDIRIYNVENDALLVGGGSILEHIKGDEICFFYNSVDESGTYLYRFREENDLNNTLDTIGTYGDILLDNAYAST